MKIFLFHILLALVWTAVTASFTIENLIIGLILGYFVLLVVGQAIDQNNYTRRLRKVIILAIYFFKELLLSSVRVAKDVLRPGFHMKSGVIAIPLDLKSDLGITLLANMISLTPGTLSLEVSDDRKELYIHAMYLNNDIENARQEIKTGMEKHILEVMI